MTDQHNGLYEDIVRYSIDYDKISHIEESYKNFPLISINCKLRRVPTIWHTTGKKSVVKKGKA